MNERQFVEASRALAERAMRYDDKAEARAAWMFRRATGRAPDADEVAVLVEAYRDHKDQFARDAAAAARLIALGRSDGTFPIPRVRVERGQQ
jgi:hypothetical protein